MEISSNPNVNSSFGMFVWQKVELCIYKRSEEIILSLLSGRRSRDLKDNEITRDRNLNNICIYIYMLIWLRQHRDTRFNAVAFN